MTLFDHVTAWLDHHAMRFALIGAGALAALEISDATLDQELLVTERRVLNRPFWSRMPAAVQIDTPTADGDDLVGHVRLAAPDQRPVHVVVGRAGWLDGVLDRAVIADAPGRDLPVAAPADLILLNLYGGEAENLSAIRSILRVSDSVELREDVESRLSFLPADCASVWQELLVERGVAAGRE